MELWGPFAQIVTLRHLPATGRLYDTQLELIPFGGISIENDLIKEVKPYAEFIGTYNKKAVPFPSVVLPGFIDCHTHLFFSRHKAAEFTLFLSGKSRKEIAHLGGDKKSTIKAIHSSNQLKSLLEKRLSHFIKQGITTIEVKTTYTEDIEEDLSQLEILKNLSAHLDLVSTFHLLKPLHPEKIKSLQLIRAYTNRLDINLEEYSLEEYSELLEKAVQLGFELHAHANAEGTLMAASANFKTVSPLNSTTQEILFALKNRHVMPILTPGSSLGQGIPFSSAREILNHGLSIAIASDTNPDTSPMGHLLTQAALLATYEKLTHAETFAGITLNAARALNLNDRGVLDKGKIADFVIFPTEDYREIIYHQGQMAPVMTVKKGLVAH